MDFNSSLFSCQSLESHLNSWEELFSFNNLPLNATNESSLDSKSSSSNEGIMESQEITSNITCDGHVEEKYSPPPPLDGTLNPILAPASSKREKRPYRGVEEGHGENSLQKKETPQEMVFEYGLEHLTLLKQLLWLMTKQLS